MRVLLCFVKFMPALSKISDVFHSLVQLCGVYSSVSLVFVPCDGRPDLVSFDVCATTNLFSEGVVRADASELGVDLFDFLDLDVGPQEYNRLLETCRACVRVRKSFNYRDTYLYNVPFREPVEKSLYETQTLFDAQAVILILRECLGQGHRLTPILHTLHSRTTLAGQLHEALSSVARTVPVGELVSMGARSLDQS
jgi:hypothetical protein